MAKYLQRKKCHSFRGKKNNPKKMPQMKQTTTIKSQLGFSQEEMALLLGVSRTQWSMYEIGKRDLPLTAKEQLASILLHQQNVKETSKEKQKISVIEKQKTQEWLKQELLNIEYKKEVVVRKLLAIENKRAESFAALEVVSFLETQEQKEPIVSLIKSIKIRATNTLNKNALHQLMELQMKKEQLEMLKNTLEQKIMKNSNEL